MASASQSQSALANTEPATTEPLYQVKLLSALRSGDPALIHPFLAEFGTARRLSQDTNTDVAAAALHLALRCASTDTVSLLLSHRSISPNAVHPAGSGTTALHLAASLGRADVVNLLLDQEGIDDTLRDRDGRTCKDVARGKDVLRAINDSRSFLTASYRSLLRTYIFSPPTAPPPPPLFALLSSPRVRLLDLSYLDDASGATLLHEAARRKDLSLIELAVRGGADIFVRDRRGRPLHDVVGKDDKVRAFLRQFTNLDRTLIEASPPTEPPVLKGYLNKYTNVARGYNTRWFVLERGVLSYYRHQEDETVASRGSISMKAAVLRVAPGGEALRFEVQSTPSRGHTSVQRWYLKANHPVEAARWTHALARAIEKHRQGAHEQAGESDALSRASVRGSISSTMSSLVKRKKGRGDADSVASSGANSDDEDSARGGSGSVGGGGVGASPNRRGSGYLGVGEPDANDASSGNASSEQGGDEHPPHEDVFDLQGNSAAAQLELTAQLLANMASASSGGGGGAGRAAELQSALRESLSSVQGMVNEYVLMAKERDEWWRARVARERERQTVWEESLASVVKEGEELERELRTQARRRSRLEPGAATADEAGGTVKRRPSVMLTLSPPPLEEDVRTPTEEAPTAVPPTVTVARRQASGGSIIARPVPAPLSPPVSVAGRASLGGLAGPESAGLDADGDTDEEDEFFDAIESNALPNLVINESLAIGHVEGELPSIVERAAYVGYENLRQTLGLNDDQRPPTSLWSVLKHSIGKDLTKISFPVFFNEPTSMLQRMAEDMEFSECLDAASAEGDPHRRLAFVAAFAMSNYSSTIGRIAKPFNPMLSETFEYVRLDKQYRYVSEQVSHHPPISACYAESPRWRYYGEVDAQNKFTGKSFEIRPTGVAHVDLLIPAARGPGYPVYEGRIAQGRVVEHYSWKKVTTNVSGFILGSPTIDHYGDMTVTNHRTGDQCVLTFKPRGWRGKDAYEISGYVADAAGTVTYEIAGRWNSQLVARAVGAGAGANSSSSSNSGSGSGAGALNPDVAVRGPGSASPTPEYVLLWRNSEKPRAPFNLTPFAITLNDCPAGTLAPFVCPTDCRLRPDQRVFEQARYELANALKTRQEEHQRAMRRAREEGRAPPHRPRWFRAETDGDTGERVWAPARTGDGALEYWVERERVFASGGKEPWTGVDKIFIDDAV